MTLQMEYQERYELGLEQGRNQEKTQFAIRMLSEGNLPPEKIAVYAGLPLEQVLKLKHDCEK